MVGTGSWVNCESYIDDEDERAASDPLRCGQGILKWHGRFAHAFSIEKHGRDAHATKKRLLVHNDCYGFVVGALLDFSPFK